MGIETTLGEHYWMDIQRLGSLLNTQKSVSTQIIGSRSTYNCIAQQNTVVNGVLGRSLHPHLTRGRRAIC